MVAKSTNGVKISVETQYQEAYSNPSLHHHVFTYSIKIENNSESTVQLLKRHWMIYDSNGELREVEGDGVVGQQPILEPGESYEYVSGCNFKTPLGKMLGTYFMERIVDGKVLKVKIPEFIMVAPYILN